MKRTPPSITILLAVLVFGIGLPWLKGLAFLNPILILCYACLGVLFIAPAATDLGALRPPSRAMLARMASLVGYGFALSLLILLSGLVTINLIDWRGQVLAPPVRFLTSALLLGLAICFAIVASGVALGMVYGATSARNALRTVLLIVVLVLAFGTRFVSEDWHEAISRELTTSGLTRFAFRTSAAAIVLGSAATALAMARARVRVP